jgi:hypothetical protein
VNEQKEIYHRRLAYVEQLIAPLNDKLGGIEKTVNFREMIFDASMGRLGRHHI